MDTKKSSTLQICQINISGLSSHSHTALNYYNNNIKNDVLAIQETMFNPADLTKTTPTFSNMESFYLHNDRGVSISARKSLNPQRVVELEDTTADVIWVTINFGSRIALVGNVYTNPSNASANSLHAALNNIDKAMAHCDKYRIKDIIIVGDFNGRNIIWKDSVTNSRGRLLADYTTSNNLVCVTPNAHTFLCTNGGSTIDLALLSASASTLYSASSADGGVELFSGAPLRGHIPVLHHFNFPSTTRSKNNDEILYKDINNTDWDLWATRLSSEVYDHIGVSLDRYHCPVTLWRALRSLITKTNLSTIPTKRVTQHSKPFWTTELSELSRSVQHNRKKMCVRYTPSNIDAYKLSKHLFAKKLTAEKNSWIRGKLENLNVTESKIFWKNYKRHIVGETQENLGNLEENGVLYTDSKDKENILFKSFFDGSHMSNTSFDHAFESDIDHYYLDVRNNRTSGQGLNTEDHTYLNTEVTFHEVYTAINDQKTTAKSFDEDEIHPTMIKKFPQNVISVLHKIFNLCFTQGKWVWDTSMVIFMKKEGKPNYMKAGAYRPISISSYVGKLFEKIIEKRLKIHCDLESILDDEQEGFRSNRNTTRYLYKVTANLKEAQRRKLTSFLLCLDFEKAFDSVWLKGLIVKLHNLKVNGKILNLIDNFLFCRKVKLIVDKSKGIARKCGNYGVPQGSVLSPLLFIIYISDMFHRNQIPPACRQHTNVFKYADDGSIAVTHEDPRECFTIAQLMCDHLSQWCKKWKMIVNCNKNKTECLVIRPVKYASSLQYNFQNLSINGKEIKYVCSTTVLGLVMDDKLMFDKHANRKLQQCWYTWYNISKNTTRHRGLNISSLVILFRAVVLSKLLYAAPVWLKNQLHKFKKFYSRVCLKISGATHFPLQNLALLAVGLEPLSVLYDVVATKFTLKSLHSDDNLNAMILQIESSRGPPFHHHTTLIKKYFNFRDSSMTFHRACRITTLAETDVSLTHYVKSDIESYKFQLWKDLLISEENSVNPLHDNTDINGSTTQYDVPPKNHKKLFHRTSSRLMDTKVMTMIHGHSRHFNSFKKALGCIGDPNCNACGSRDDAYHQLLECTKYNSNYRKPLQSLITDGSHSFMWSFIMEADEEQLACFRNMAQIILDNPKHY